MRNFKRILTLGLAALMLFAVLSVSAFAAQSKFTDVNAKDETLTKAVSLLEGIGVTYGTSDTTFGTNDPVTRQQMAAFIYRLMKSGKTLEGGENTTPFVDLYDDTYYSMVSWANSLGIIKGVSETEFDPDGSIILQDAYTMLVRALDYEKSETLAYPFDFINIAEKTGVTLNKGLPSSVSYEKELTRGNVAILLYNAFYAETGVPEIVEKERLIGQNTAKPKYVLEKKEVYPTLCEKYYNVIEEEFIIRETTHYAFNDSENSNTYKPTEDSNGENSVLLVATESDQKMDSFYTNFEELGIEGDSDDYIFSNVKLFYTYDADKKQVEKILFAEPLLQKASADSATYGTVKGDRTRGDFEHYYGANDNFNNPRMDGSMIVAGKTLYFFDAPYSFLKPSYDGSTEEERYEARNADNTRLIDLKCLDIDKALYTYYIRDDVEFVTKDGAVYNASTKKYEEGPADKPFANTFHQVRSNGVYRMDIFDPDGDGRYEYMWYKPATFGKIDMTNSEEFSEHDEYAANKPTEESVKNASSNEFKVVPVIYANGAVIDGADGTTYRDGDFVAAYLNGDANYMYIFGTAQAKTGTITKVPMNATQMYLGSQRFEVCSQYKLFTNYFTSDKDTWNPGDHNFGTYKAGHPFSYLLANPEAPGSEVLVYLYKNQVVYFNILDQKSGTYSGEKLLIPLATQTATQLNEDSLEDEQYLKVWVDGEEQYVKVDVENCYPAPEKNADGTYNFSVRVFEDEDGTKYRNAYSICTYTVDKDGFYTLVPLLHSQDEDGNADHVKLTFTEDDFFSDKSVTQVGSDLGGMGWQAKIKVGFANRIELLGTDGRSVLGNNKNGFFESANLTNATTIIIRETTTNSKGKPEVKFYTYTGTQFPGTMKYMMNNVQYIYENSGTSRSRVNLVFLYGELEEGKKLEFQSAATKKSDWRIIRSVTPYKIADKEYCFAYEVYNLSTGEIDDEVLGSNVVYSSSEIEKAKSLPIGALVEIAADGTLDDEDIEDDLMILDASTNLNLAHILYVDTDANYVDLLPINEDDLEYFYESETYEVSDKAVIVKLTLDDISDISSAEISTLTLEDIADGGKAIKSYNSFVPNERNPEKLEEKYSDYAKAYVIYSEPTKSNTYPVIDTIIVIVNPDEPDDVREPDAD